MLLMLSGQETDNISNNIKRLMCSKWKRHKIIEQYHGIAVLNFQWEGMDVIDW